MALSVYVLDNGACSSNEDFHPNRWVFQTETVRCLSRALGSDTATQPSAGRPEGTPAARQCAAVSCVPRPRLIAPPGTSEALMAALREVEVPQEGVCQLAPALKLALLTARQAHEASVVAFVGSQMALSEAEARQVAAQFVAARTRLDIVILGEADSVFPDAALDVLIQAANASSNSAASADTPSPQPPARLVRFAAPDVAQRETMPLWQQLEGLLEQLEAPARPRHEDSEGTCDSDGDGDGDGDDDGGHIDALHGIPVYRPAQLRAVGGRLQVAGAAGAGVSLSPPPALVIRGRSSRPASCRCESLDSLQHLSGDGFLRSWLPSYSNITRIVPSKGLGGEASKYCFLSVCQMQAPKWQTLLTLRAGRVVLQQPEQPQQTASCPSSPKQPGGAPARPFREPSIPASSMSAGDQHTQQLRRPEEGANSAQGMQPSASAPAPSAAALLASAALQHSAEVQAAAGPSSAAARPSTLTESREVQNGLCAASGSGRGSVWPMTTSMQDVDKMLSELLDADGIFDAGPRSSKGASDACEATSSWGSPASMQSHKSIRLRPQRVVADPRPGTLKLMVSTHDSCLVKLVWCERKKEAEHRSLFEAAQRKGYGPTRPSLRRAAAGADSDSGDSDDEDSDEEEDSEGESADEEHARRGSSSNSSSERWEVELVLSPTRTAFAAVPGTGGRVLEVRSPASVRRGSQDRAVLDSAGKPRFLFWLQQPYTSKAGLSASTALSTLGRQDAAVGSTPVAANPAAAAAQDLQALLECPPDWSDQAGGVDVSSGLPGVSSSSSGRRRRAGRKPMGQPLQVGPLPRSLIEDLMKSTGRQLLPDGRIVMASPNTAPSSEDEVWGSSVRPAMQLLQEAEKRRQQEQWQQQRCLRQHDSPTAMSSDQRRQRRAPAPAGQADDVIDQLRHGLSLLKIPLSGPDGAASISATGSEASGGETEAAVARVAQGVAGSRQSGNALPSHPLYDLDDYISPPAPPAATSRTSTSMSGCAGMPMTSPSGASTQDTVLPMFFPGAAAASQGGNVAALASDPAAQHDTDSLLFELD